MFWFRRPHYLRLIAGATLVLIAFAMDMTKGATAPYPFAAADLERGHILSDEDVDWRDVPVGLLPEHDLSAGRLTRPLSAGEPILLFSIGARAAIPSDWWAVPLDLPESVAAGASVRIVLLNPVLAVDGIVVEPGGMGTFGVTEAALVAVPGEAAVSVARAAVRNELTILISPAGGCRVGVAGATAFFRHAPNLPQHVRRRSVGAHPGTHRVPPDLLERPPRPGP